MDVFLILQRPVTHLGNRVDEIVVDILQRALAAFSNASVVELKRFSWTDSAKTCILLKIALGVTYLLD